MAKLMSQLKISKAKGTMRTELKRIERADLLIPDDFCMQPATRRPVSWGILMGIIDNDHIVDSRKRLYDAIGEKNIADAVLDRVEFFDESIRKRKFNLR